MSVDPEQESNGKNCGTVEEEKVLLRDFSWRDCNLIFAMPLFCTIGLTMPFIYFVIAMQETYGLAPGVVGPLFASFHVCRIVAVFGASFAPRISHTTGTVIGIAGYTGLLIFSDTTNSAIFASCNIVVGFSDAWAAMFVYAKQCYSTNMEKMRVAMSYQATVIGVGFVLGFLFGGLVFERYGISGIACVGIVTIGLELVSLIYFLVAPPSEKSAPVDENRNDQVVVPAGDGDDRSKKMQRFRQSTLTESIKTGKNKELMSKYSDTEEIVASSFTYLVAAMFSFESISCGYLYAIGPLFIYDNFHVNEGLIGLIYAVASGFASILTVLTVSPKGRELQRKYTRSPYNLYMSLIVTNVSCAGLLIPSFSVQCICIILIHGGIELFLAFMAELQGAITPSHDFAVLGPTSQLSRKIVSVIMSLTGPTVYKVFPRLPYVISTLLCFICTSGFIFCACKQQQNNAAVIASMISLNRSVREEESTEVAKQCRRMTLEYSECFARMADYVIKAESFDDDDAEARSNITSFTSMKTDSDGDEEEARTNGTNLTEMKTDSNEDEEAARSNGTNLTEIKTDI